MCVPFLVLQLRGIGISGSDVAKIRRLVEKNAGKVGDNNASAAAAATAAAAGGIGISSGGVGPKGKVSLPPALETTPRPIGVEDADAAVGKKKGGTSSANGNLGGTIAPPASLTTATNGRTKHTPFRACRSRSCHAVYEKKIIRKTANCKEKRCMPESAG